MEMSTREERGCLEILGEMTFGQRALQAMFKYTPGKLAALQWLQRLSGYCRYVPNFYGLATPLFAACFGSHNIHVGYFETGHEDWLEAQERLTHLIGDACAIEPTDRLLDVGCGIGGPSVSMAARFGCRVAGLNITKSQIRWARRYAARRGLENKVTFVHGDAMKMDFAAGSFDGAYAIESMTHMPSKSQVIGEVARVTGPGAQFAIINVCLEDPAIMRSNRDYRLFGFATGVRPEDWIRPGDVPRGFRELGFTLVEERDLTAKIVASERAWTDFVRGRQDDIVSRFGKGAFDLAVRVMEIGRDVIGRQGSYRMWVGRKAE